jgi:hypothetical protein
LILTKFPNSEILVNDDLYLEEDYTNQENGEFIEYKDSFSKSDINTLFSEYQESFNRF